MGTSAKIIVKTASGDKSNIVLYKHYDGYPQGTLDWLKEFNEGYVRQEDTPYKLAQLIRSTVFLGEKHRLDPCQVTGWGVYAANSAPTTDYTYVLHCNGDVTYSRSS